MNQPARKNSLSFLEPVLTEQEREAQTKMIIRLFELWQLTLPEQALFLGLSPKTRTPLHQYKTGKARVSLSRDTQERVRELFTIHAQLKKLFPRNPEWAYGWIQTPNRFFNELSPKDIICRDGFRGLFAVRQYLDQSLAI